MPTRITTVCGDSWTSICPGSFIVTVVVPGCWGVILLEGGGGRLLTQYSTEFGDYRANKVWAVPRHQSRFYRGKEAEDCLPFDCDMFHPSHLFRENSNGHIRDDACWRPCPAANFRVLRETQFHLLPHIPVAETVKDSDRLVSLSICLFSWRFRVGSSLQRSTVRTCSSPPPLMCGQHSTVQG